MRNILVVLNSRAGTLLDRDPAAVKVEVQQVLSSGGRHVDVELAHGRGMVRAIESGATAGYDTVIVGGGDGSANCAANRLVGTDIVLGVLPLGTLNLLARDLRMPTDLSAALPVLAAGHTRRIDLATLNGRRFHSISGLGFFSQMARAREEARDFPTRLLRLGVAAFSAFTRTGQFTLSFDIDGEAREMQAFAALVTVNRFARDWRRGTLDGGVLEVHIAEHEGGLAKLKAGADVLTGAWRDNGFIHSFTAQRVRIAARRPRVWVATDGELLRESMPLEFSIEPKALTVLAP